MLVDRAPQVPLCAVDLHKHLIKVPLIARAGAPPAQVVGVDLPEGTVNLSNPRAIFAGSPSRFTRSRVTYEAYVVSRMSTRP